MTPETLLAELACDNSRCDCQASARRGRGRSHCPGHPDRSPSLNVTPKPGAIPPFVVYCHAGCEQGAVVAELRRRGLFPPLEGAANRDTGAATTRYAYRDATGAVLAIHVREDRPGQAKRMWWAKPDGSPSRGASKPERLPLYRLPELLATDPDDLVIVVEGERACDATLQLGFTAVTLAGGASQQEFGNALLALSGRHVVLWPDNDNAGRALMRRVAERLAGVAASVRRIEPRDLPEKGDAADYVAAGRTRDELLALIAVGAPPAATPTEGFPVEVLPEPARAYVSSAARALGVPVGFVALPLLVCAGAVMGNGVAIAPKLDFRQYATLWGIVVGDPGTAKSPALRRAAAPIEARQRVAHRRWTLQMEEYNEQLAAWEATPKRERGVQPPQPKCEEFFTTDATLEAITEMIYPPPGPDADQSATTGLAWVADELAGWVRSFNQYKGGQGSDRQNWLSSWSGSTLKVDRKSGKLYVEDPVVGITGAIQPEVLAVLRMDAGARDGFFERPLFCFDTAKPAPWSEETVDERTASALHQVFTRLRRPLRAQSPVTLTPQALREWRRWYDDNQQLVAAESGALSGYYAKLPVQLARLTLILHALANPDGYHATQVSEATLLNAISLVEYFREQAHRALGLLGITHSDRQGGLRARLLQRLREADGEPVAKRDLYEVTKRNVSAAEIDAELMALAEDGAVERVEGNTGTHSGRPSVLWRALPNPASKRSNEQTPTPQGNLLVYSFVRKEEAATPRAGDAQRAADHGLAPEVGCQICGEPTDAKGACWGCNDRPCNDCGSLTGSPLRAWCAACGMAASSPR